MKAVLCGLVLAICAAVAPVATATRGSEQLTITVRNGDFGDRLYTLGCDPAAGTVRKPSAACATLHAHPDLLEPHPGQDHHCPPGTPRFEIAGTSGGAARAVSSVAPASAAAPPCKNNRRCSKPLPATCSSESSLVGLLIERALC